MTDKDGSCNSRERLPLLATREGGGDDRRLANIPRTGIILQNSATSRRRRSYGTAVAAGAVLLGLALVGVVAVFESIENNAGLPRSTSSASMAAVVVHHLEEDETTKTTTATTTAEDIDKTGMIRTNARINQ